MKSQVLKHCAQCAGYHMGMAKLHKARAAAMDGDDADFHQTCVDMHMNQAEHYMGMAQDMRDESASDGTNDDSDDELKAAKGERFGMTAARDFSKTAPPLARAVLPDTPAVTLIPRFGGPPIEAAPKVDPQFAHLVDE